MIPPADQEKNYNASTELRYEAKRLTLVVNGNHTGQRARASSVSGRVTYLPDSALQQQERNDQRTDNRSDGLGVGLTFRPDSSATLV